jgi:hypothetical protein
MTTTTERDIDTTKSIRRHHPTVGDQLVTNRGIVPTPGKEV